MEVPVLSDKSQMKKGLFEGMGTREKAGHLLCLSQPFASDFHCWKRRGGGPAPTDWSEAWLFLEEAFPLKEGLVGLEKQLGQLGLRLRILPPTCERLWLSALTGTVEAHSSSQRTLSTGRAKP